MKGTNNKNARYAFRIHKYALDHLRDLAKEMNTNVTDLLVTGALSLAARAQNPSGYFRERSTALEHESELMKEGW